MFTNTYVLKVSSELSEEEIDRALHAALLELSKSVNVSISKVASIKKEKGSILLESGNNSIHF